MAMLKYYIWDKIYDIFGINWLFSSLCFKEITGVYKIWEISH